MLGAWHDTMKMVQRPWRSYIKQIRQSESTFSSVCVCHCTFLMRWKDSIEQFPEWKWTNTLLFSYMVDKMENLVYSLEQLNNEIE